MKACVSGVGPMGQRHIQVLQSRGIEVVGLHDQNFSQADGVAAKSARTARVYSTALEMLRIERPTHYVIATNTAGRLDLCKTALRMGIPLVLAEKPPFSSASEAEALVELREASQALTTIGFNFCERFSPIAEEIRSRMKNKYFVEPHSAHYSGGNFGLAANSIHFADLFQHVTGHQLRDVQFFAENPSEPNPRGPHLIDLTGLLVARGSNGRSLTVATSFSASHGLITTWNFKHGYVIGDLIHNQVFSSHRKPDDLHLASYRYGSKSELLANSLPAANVIAQTSKVWDSIEKGCDFVGLAEAVQLCGFMGAAYLSSLNDGAVFSPMQRESREVSVNWI